jgi:hypothetical protein
MATQIIEILSDSLDERIKNGVENVVFFHPLTGEKLEIQLGEANRNHFARHLDKLTKYIDAAEVVAEPVVETKPKAAAKNSETTKIREWAKANGFQIGDRGRIKAEIVEAYKAAHEVISEQEVAPEDTETAEVTPEAITGDDVMNLLDEVTAEAPDAVSVSTAAEIEAALDAGQITPAAAMELLDELTEVDSETASE